MSDVSEEQRGQYLSEGYCIFRGLADRQKLTLINEEIAELFATQLRRLRVPVEPGSSREAFRANARALIEADVPTYINTARITQMLPSVHELLSGGPILRMVKGLGLDFPVISTRCSIHIMSDDLKVPGGYHKTPPHQDWRSIQGSLDNVVLWLPTTPVTANSYALEIVPKSHLFGLLPTVDHIMTPSTSDERIQEADYIGVPVEPGDVIAFSAFTVHRTGEEGDGLVRIALSARFNNAHEPTFVNHGYPTPYSYSYRKDLMYEGFPTKDELRTVFPQAR